MVAFKFFGHRILVVFHFQFLHDDKPLEHHQRVIFDDLGRI